MARYLDVFTLISIHSPLAGRDQAHIIGAADDGDFNPLAPRGARQGALLPAGGRRISIHSPLAGRDLISLLLPCSA